jgi:hypothetical protein
LCGRIAAAVGASKKHYAVFSGRATFQSTGTTGQTVAVWTAKGSWHLVWDAPDTNSNPTSSILMTYSQKVTTGCSATVRLTKAEVVNQFLSVTQLGSRSRRGRHGSR